MGVAKTKTKDFIGNPSIVVSTALTGRTQNKNYICRAYTINKRHMLNIFMLFYCIALKGKLGIEPNPEPPTPNTQPQAHMTVYRISAHIRLVWRGCFCCQNLIMCHI